MDIGVILNVNETTLSVLDLAPAAEDRGMNCIFQGEHSHVPVDTVYRGSHDGKLPDWYRRFPDVFVTLTAAAAVTSRIRLGTGIILVAEHNPFHLAKATATLDQISGGRLDFGVGYGWNPPEMLNNGVPWENRREIFGEKLAVIERLWTEDEVAADGEYVKFTEPWVWPKPLQKPHPPVLLGAAGFRWQLEDIVRLCDGWYPMDRPELPARLKTLRKMMADAGRSELALTINYMAGQLAGAPWYWEDKAAMDTLLEKLSLYQELGADRMVVGIPTDAIDRAKKGLDSLSSLLDRFA